MPRYYYHCNNCHGDFLVHHLMNEKQRDCSLCESNDIAKLLTKPLFFKKKDDKSSGKLTKKYIEENKEALEELKKEAQKDYDGT
jgi:putative FmdB family regulatory protein